MVLVPFESRYIANRDYNLRQEDNWNQRCWGLISMLSVRAGDCVYCSKSYPLLGRADLSVMFLDSKLFVSQSLSFSSYSIQSKVERACIGCQDGLMVEHLAQHWKWISLPLQSQESIIFHNPSPTKCIQKGYVWFDHPLVHRTDCISKEQIGWMRMQNAERYDFDFYDKFKVCMRFTQKGFYRSLPRRNKKVPRWTRLHDLKDLQLMGIIPT